MINTLRKEEEVKSKDKYPWLDDSDERKYMSDKEILDKYIDLDNSCLTKREKKEVRSLIYEYRDAFSLQDKIGTCSNIEVEIDMTDKSPFFIRPFHAREEDKANTRQGNEKIVLFRYFEGKVFQPIPAQSC